MTLCFHPTSWLLGDLALDAGATLHQVHQEVYAADAFNPSTKGNARFSPIQDGQGHVIPTIYAAHTFDGALMETVFPGVPYALGPKQFSQEKLAGQLHSCLTISTPLILADLTSTALRAMGVQRNQFIDTEADQYPATRKWAIAVHAQHPQAQGLLWVSRQDDTDRAVLLFGDRITPEALRQIGKSRLLTSGSGLEKVVLLADRIGVNIVP